jgi:hypothetical protein
VCGKQFIVALKKLAEQEHAVPKGYGTDMTAGEKIASCLLVAMITYLIIAQ